MRKCLVTANTHIICWFAFLCVSLLVDFGSVEAFANPKTTITRQCPQNYAGVKSSCSFSSFRKGTVTCHSLPSVASWVPSSVLLTLLAEKDDIALEQAFQDDVDIFGDPTIRLMFGGFAVFVVAAILLKALMGKMDTAIQSVLVEFESTMKAKYKARWVNIEKRLEGLQEPERSQRLFEIMEQLQRDEPAFMEEVRRNGGSSVS